MDNGDKGPAAARDGLIDFAGYTTEQLAELETSIDLERFPLNHARLVEELKRRERAETSNSPPRDRWGIRFSRAESFWSWVQAKRRRQWFYGHGFLDIQPAEIVLSGWQRTWLGMPVQGERRIALESIRNVWRDDATVTINVAGSSVSGRKLVFDCDSPESALSLCGRLPPVRDSVFEREWQEMRAFHGALYAPKNYPWGATTLVLINVLVFLVFFINTKSWFGVPPQLLTIWGSNYGPLTVGGQWWRLLSSLFLHLSPLHLVLNMWVLWNVGRLAERLFGHSVFLTQHTGGSNSMAARLRLHSVLEISRPSRIYSRSIRPTIPTRQMADRIATPSKLAWKTCSSSAGYRPKRFSQARPVGAVNIPIQSCPPS